MSRQRRHFWMVFEAGGVVEEGKPHKGAILVEFDEGGISKQMRQYICERKKADAVCDATSRLCAILREFEEPLKPYC